MENIITRPGLKILLYILLLNIWSPSFVSAMPDPSIIIQVSQLVGGGDDAYGGEEASTHATSTTEASTTAVSTTEAITTAASTTEASTTETLASTHATSTTEASTTAVSTTEAFTTAASTAEASTTETLGAECPSPWFTVSGQCFLVVGNQSYLDRRNWASARADCNAASPGADLAQPNDLEALAEYLDDMGYSMWANYWLGGSDLTTEGVWAWINGGGPITSGWWGGNTTPDTYYHCLTMYPVEGAESLYDDRCENHQRYICQRN